MYRGFNQSFTRACRTNFTNTTRSTFNARFGSQQQQQQSTLNFSQTTTFNARFSSTSRSSTATQSEILTTTRTNTTSNTTKGQRSNGSNQSKSKQEGSNSHQQSSYSKTAGSIFNNHMNKSMLSLLSSRPFGSLALLTADTFLLFNYAHADADDA